ncbi:transposase IS3/IS911 family protein [Arthrobacter sp. Hiyo4]|nr:transposase IS3/IS911 family protein [Arthrobacter sp. Hiyo4]
MSARPTYSDEFKADAVSLVISSGRSPASVAPELGISVTALKRWVRLHNESQSEGGANRMIRWIRRNTRLWKLGCVKSRGKMTS